MCLIKVLRVMWRNEMRLWMLFGRVAVMALLMCFEVILTKLGHKTLITWCCMKYTLLCRYCRKQIARWR